MSSTASSFETEHLARQGERTVWVPCGDPPFETEKLAKAALEEHQRIHPGVQFRIVRVKGSSRKVLAKAGA